MKVEQIYTGCLAQGAYYIESNGEAAVIDPLRETSPYLKRAEESGAKIKYIFETHFHADFVSGHLDLAEKTGATIVYGPNADTAFAKYETRDGEELLLGNLKIKVLHTPGHTPESTCYLLYDETGKEYAVFTGDTLFIGDVGRPDLAQKKGSLTKEDLAGWLYDSLRNKLMPLPNDTIVYPAHGAGSACGKNMSSETWSTIGNQKESNYALRANMTREEFIREVTEGLAAPPQYFAKNAKINKTGYESIDVVMERGARALSPQEVIEAVEHENALVLDVRSPQLFCNSHIPGSISIGLDGQFAPWVGALITDLSQAIVVVADAGREEETVVRLARVGYDHCIGFLEGGMEAWIKAGKETEQIESIPAVKLAEIYHQQPDIKIIDVRKPSEFSSDHLRDAENIPLDFINDHMDAFNAQEPYYLLCRSGYRSVVFASIMKARGLHNLVDIAGGYNEVIKTDMPRAEVATAFAG
ncbi:MAG: MBL fold metallo-hydrolase [Saprospiraceae bacterium]|nr:MBL fold metallo-hydrolase [Saprospiraceae bacterium]